MIIKKTKSHLYNSNKCGLLIKNNNFFGIEIDFTGDMTVYDFPGKSFDPLIKNSKSLQIHENSYLNFWKSQIGAKGGHGPGGHRPKVHWLCCIVYAA